VTEVEDQRGVFRTRIIGFQALDSVGQDVARPNLDEMWDGGHPAGCRCGVVVRSLEASRGMMTSLAGLEQPQLAL
jgi:hypothetical protein